MLNTNYGFGVGILFIDFINFESLFVCNEGIGVIVDPIEWTSWILTLVVIGEFGLPVNENFISGFLGVVSALVVRGEEFMFSFMDGLNFNLRRTLLFVYKLFLTYSYYQLYSQQVGVIRKLFVCCWVKLEVPEMRSFPSKGGGDDTNLETTIIDNICHGECVFVLEVLTSVWVLIRIDSCLDWLLHGRYYCCTTTRVDICLVSRVRNTWFGSWTNIYLVSFVLEVSGLHLTGRGTFHMESFVRFVWLVAWNLVMEFTSFWSCTITATQRLPYCDAT